MTKLEKAYWSATLIFICAWLGYFYVNLNDFVSWFADDWATVRKIDAGIFDWRQMFTYRANLLQPYFLLVVPIANSLRVFFSDTGWIVNQIYYEPQLFRSVTFVASLINLGFLACLYYLTKVLLRSDIYAITAVVLVVVSSSYNLWFFQPETRYVGFIPVLVALAIGCKQHQNIGFIDNAHAFWIGVLFTLGMNLHYTAAYLIVPMVFVYAPIAYSRLKNREFSVFIFALLGPVIIYGSLEVMSFLAGINPTRGVVASTIWYAFFAHRTEDIGLVTHLYNIFSMLSYFGVEFGVGLSLYIVAGGYWFFRFFVKKERSIFTYLLLVALVSYLLVSPLSTNAIFFRKALGVQILMVPLLLAAIQRFLLSKGAFNSGALLLTWLLVAGTSQAGAVRESHFELGKWEKSPEAQKLITRDDFGVLLPRTDFITPESLLLGQKYNWIMVEFPRRYFELFPRAYQLFRTAKPHFQITRPWSTTTVMAEHANWIGYEAARFPLMGFATIYDVDLIRDALQQTRSVEIDNFEYRRNGELLDIETEELFQDVFRSNGVPVAHYAQNDEISITVEFSPLKICGRLGLQIGRFRPHEITPENVTITVVNTQLEKDFKSSVANLSDPITEAGLCPKFPVDKIIFEFNRVRRFSRELKDGLKNELDFVGIVSDQYDFVLPGHDPVSNRKPVSELQKGLGMARRSTRQGRVFSGFDSKTPLGVIEHQVWSLSNDQRIVSLYCGSRVVPTFVNFMGIEVYVDETADCTVDYYDTLTEHVYVY